MPMAPNYGTASYDYSSMTPMAGADNVGRAGMPTAGATPAAGMNPMMMAMALGGLQGMMGASKPEEVDLGYGYKARKTPGGGKMLAGAVSGAGQAAMQMAIQQQMMKQQSAQNIADYEVKSNIDLKREKKLQEGSMLDRQLSADRQRAFEEKQTKGTQEYQKGMQEGKFRQSEKMAAQEHEWARQAANDTAEQQAKAEYEKRWAESQAKAADRHASAAKLGVKTDPSMSGTEIQNRMAEAQAARHLEEYNLKKEGLEVKKSVDQGRQAHYTTEDLIKAHQTAAKSATPGTPEYNQIISDILKKNTSGFVADPNEWTMGSRNPR